MKTLPTLLAVVALAGLAGCRNLGYNDHSLTDSATPTTSQTTYVRTYDQNGNPIIKEEPSTPAADAGGTGNSSSAK